MIWLAPFATRIWNRLFCYLANISFMRSALDNGLSKIWTIFAQNANISLTSIRFKISMKKRQNKILLIEWGLSFRSNEMTMTIRHKTTKKISSDLRIMNSSSWEMKKILISMCLPQKKSKDNIKKMKNWVQILSFINSFLNLIKSSKDK